MIEDIPTRIIARFPRTRRDIPRPVARDNTLAKPSRRLAENEIDGAFDVAVAVVLRPGFGV